MTKFGTYIIAAISGIVLGLALAGNIPGLWGVVAVVGLAVAQVAFNVAKVEDELRNQNGKDQKWF